MELRDEIPLLRSVFIWTAAFVLGLVLFGTVDSVLEPESVTLHQCPGTGACWDLRNLD